MSFSKQIPFHLFLILVLILTNSQVQALSSTSTSTSTSLSLICKSMPYPDVCFHSLKLSVSININTNIILHQSLQVAISEAVKLLTLLSDTDDDDIIEKQKGSIQDCNELHQITLSSLNKSLTTNNLPDARAFLGAALTNKNTCLEGLESASGPLKPLLVDTITTAYKHVSNSLSLLSADNPLPKWLSRKDFLIGSQNETDYDDDDYSSTLVVATDGSGNFTTITNAINFAPNNSVDRIIIYIKQGLYEENVEIPSYKPNIVLLGEGRDITIISGNRSVIDGWTTFRSATVGEGFLARDIGFHNVAGPEKHQAVALRINADFAAVFRCVISSYQDSLYVHSFRQFYRECDIYGTIDYIFGNAAVVFQGCNIISRMPMPGQFTVIAAQSRDSPDQQTGISFQNCSILATEDLRSTRAVRSYLGRPWRPYSRTVFIESYIDDLIDPMGWIHWSGDQGLDTLYYGEFGNIGPGSTVDGRVTWPGHHVMDYYEATNFTVSEFITGQEWLDSTSFPYDDWV
ncbi:probable pectinesterase/pectinesterase inhibitor 12 isoform X2 [Cynara cardunculus var. scolymus]|uniref:probable pectinesterase/pectinesterase inhibitor 12 isoform X2 n=1 Tax=Cynara cardunculus var. scolymus TaxID=59895 RepID=UPI000D62E2E0|nr:probable pectinesterase/pectinesterase inhibitor 12 isoform X2 [Cynara cardunculus var. scolymus]